MKGSILVTDSRHTFVDTERSIRTIAFIDHTKETDQSLDKAHIMKATCQQIEAKAASKHLQRTTSQFHLI